MPDADTITVTSEESPTRDGRRPIEYVVRFNREEIPEVEAVEADEDAGIEAVEAVAAIPAGTKLEEIEVRYAKYSKANDRTRKNPDGVVAQSGASVYRGANAQALYTRLFKPAARAELKRRLADNIIDVGDVNEATI